MAAWVARPHQPAALATSMMARVDRLDLLLGYMEEMMQRRRRRQHRRSGSTATSSPSTPATGGGGDDDSSDDGSTPRWGGSKSSSWRSSCRPRPAKEALEEAQAKGSLVDRIAFLEDRVLKMEEDITPAPPTEDDDETTMMRSHGDATSKSSSGTSKKKGLKSLVKSCVRGKLKTKG